MQLKNLFIINFDDANFKAFKFNSLYAKTMKVKKKLHLHMKKFKIDIL
jgi:hypothetical protein